MTKKEIIFNYCRQKEKIETEFKKFIKDNLKDLHNTPQFELQIDNFMVKGAFFSQQRNPYFLKTEKVNPDKLINYFTINKTGVFLDKAKNLKNMHLPEIDEFFMVVSYKPFRFCQIKCKFKPKRRGQ